MAKYLARTCPKCGNYLGVVIGETLNQLRTVPVIAFCLRCSYQVNWKVITGSKPAETVTESRGAR